MNLIKESSLIEFWEQLKFDFPLLYKWAQVVLAVPDTQVSAERTF